MLDNLISNAIKYTKENGEIIISITQKEDKWAFLICNPTSKEIDIKKIFQKYHRQQEEIFGLGIGLELVQSICKKRYQHYRWDREWVVLHENGVTSDKMKILLMEDELHLRQNIKKFLTIKGYKVDDFENGEQLLKYANLHDYDCMILDVNTPEIDGFEVLEYIRENDILTPTIFISALTDVEKVLKAFELGAADYLKKPFDLAELEARMLRTNPKKSINSHVQLDENFRYNLQNRTLLKNEIPSKLSSIQKKFLYLLIKNQNKLVTFDMLRDYVWEGKEISHGTILSTTRDLKKILPDSFIQNVKGEGYIGVIQTIK